MRIALFTATVRPGMDVSLASVERQTLKPDLWIIADHLANYRRGLWEKHSPVPTVVFNQRNLTERQFTIAAAYNGALTLCRNLGDIDLLITMEDYVWLPEHGIEDMAALAEKHPRSLLTAILSGSADPDPSLVVDPEGLFTIFAEPYTGHPQEIDWFDCRLDRGSDFQRIEPTRWEPPFAAITRKPLYDERLAYDERYDDGMTHSNQQFAELAHRLGYGIWLDPMIQALGLPHRRYFPEEAARFWNDDTNNHAFHERMMGRA